MYLIVGLGNPGKEYEKSRHNAGFMTIDEVSNITGISIDKKGHMGLYGKGFVEGVSTILLKPQTYMNNSGISVASICEYFKIPPENVIIIYDDIDIDLGKLRIREKGSAGSHNGMKSIVKNLGTMDFPRVRIGIGKSEYKKDLADYVLETMNKQQLEQLCVVNGAKAAIEIIKTDVQTAQSMYNIK